MTLQDDLDGGSADETVTFGLDGRSYEIDLTTKNADKLRKTLAPYVAAGRRAGRIPRQGPFGRSTAASDGNTAAIRAWAIEQGYEVSSRGRISADIRAAYEAS